MMLLESGKRILSRLRSEEDSAVVYRRRYYHMLETYIAQPEFKRMLSRVEAEQARDNFRSIAVMSHYPGEGKTLYVAALALGFTLYLRRRVLIMDTVHQTMDESFYFQSLLHFEEERLPSSASRGETRGSLDLLTTRAIDLQIYGTVTGRGSQARRPFDVSDFMIGSFLKKQSARYDLVLLDTCALSGVTPQHMDPVVLATQTDRVVVMISPRSQLAKPMAALRRTLSDERIRVLGMVANDWCPPADTGQRH